MDIHEYIAEKTGVAQEALAPGLVRLGRTKDGTVTVVEWNVAGLTKPTDVELSAILSQKAPPNLSVIRRICGDVITATADAVTQMNAAALVTAGRATPAQVSGYGMMLDWIAACRAHCRALKAAADVDFATQAASYPAPSADLKTFLKSV